MTHKFDNPVRVAELAPLSTLRRIGLSEGMVFCDIGAGTGVFSSPATEYATVYAVDISEQMRKILCEKCGIHVVGDISVVPDGGCDIAMLCTVLHELTDIPGMMVQIKRILKKNGTLAVIDFHKSQTPMGPPIERRISADDAIAALKNGFALTDRFDLGENFYCLTFAGV